ncbi:plasmid mobilization relaxosome protein MobC [Candidatus Merdisoma sp. JLR.KK006]|uniref:plasmid mobilization protein n=1 Tax=Candidatus Merdisoma sp. JLR.KK006 TaxID=3112626 RepID=UPI002FF19EEA
MPEGKKEIIKPFRLTRKEADRLKEQARERGMKESEYLRLLLSQKPKDYPEIRILLKELIGEVSAIGNNVNQIARNHNSKLYRMEDREFLLACMKKLNLTVQAAVDKIGDL